MPTLRLGVLDVPYEKHVPEELKRVRVRTKKGDKPHRAPAASPAGGKTTGDVAEILEAEYHVMEIFFEEHQQQIAGALEETMGDMFEDMLSGAPSPMGTNSMVAATSSIETMFRQWIDRKGMDGLQPGVPTKASLKGVNHRLKHPFAKNNPVRPSFKDTGAYEQSFRAEIDLES